MARRHRTKEREISTASHGAAATPVHKPAPAADHFRHALLGAAAALLVARPLVPSDGGAWMSDGQVAAALWIALAALWVVQSLGRPRLRVRFGWVDAAMVAFIGWWSAASLMGAADAAPRPSINMLWEGVAILLAFLLFRQLVDPADRNQDGENGNSSRRESRALVAVMIAVAVCLAITAIYQYFVLMPRDREQFAKNPAAMFRDAQIDMLAPGTREFRRFADRLNSPEPTATFDLTNSLASYLAPWLVIAIGIGIFGWGFSKSRLSGRRNWLAVGACALPVALALALTHSRSAWIGAGVGFACLVFWRLVAKGHVLLLPLRERAGVRGIGIAALIVAILAGAVIVSRPQLLQPAIRSFQVRLDYWRATTAMIADRPWWGCGPGNFDDYYTQYKLPAAFEEIKDPHNFALEIAADAGLPALILLLIVLAGFAFRLWRRGAIAVEAAAEMSDRQRTADGTWWIFGGAMIGFWIALAWNRFIAGYPAWEEEAFVRMLAAGIVWWLLWPWIERGTLPPRLCGLGVLVLLVALLAVGGITFGGVNETLWLLLALGLNATEKKRCQEPIRSELVCGRESNVVELVPDTFSWSLPWAVNLPLLAVVVGLWIAQHQTAYEPTLGCQGAMDSATDDAAAPDQKARKQAEEKLRVAAESDVYAVEPLRRLASRRLMDWLHGDKLGIVDFENSMKQAIALEPQSAPLLAEAGNGWRLVFEATKLPADGRKAIDFYRRAIELYPTGVVVQFDLAETLSAMGDVAAAKTAAREALDLDNLRPDSERALTDEQRKLAERIILGDNRSVIHPPAVRLGPPPPTAPRQSR